VNVGNVAELTLREALAQVADVLVHAEGHEVPGERRRQRLQQADLHRGTPQSTRVGYMVRRELRTVLGVGRRDRQRT
jgi:hypothetical protein